jgi:uncharacterized protein YjbI with pentapeptide repeats
MDENCQAKQQKGKDAMALKFGTRWQKSRVHSWWQKIRPGLGWLWQKMRQHPYIATGIIVIFIAVTAFVFLVHMFGWAWTGFNGGDSKTTTTSTTHGITTATEHLLTRTLWDWLQLLIVPLMLAVGGFWLNQIQKSRDVRATEQRDKTEREIAADNQREAALQAYLDNMSELLLEKKLRDSAEEDEIRKIARVRTLTVLRRLDPIRKASVIQFLHESGLINKDKRIINLSGAGLSGADLSGAILSEAILSSANLWRADLWRADLSSANLWGANLSGADLWGANLSDAAIGVTFEELEKQVMSLKGATMPDGSKHP